VAIPVALALSCLVLGVRYRMVHIVGVSICLMGVGCLVWAGIKDNKDPTATGMFNEFVSYLKRLHYVF
jgi:solute carrier family 35 protein F1/2